jgi:hypothetical protein
MEDRSAHFLNMVGRVCDSARVAKLPVELVLAGGERLVGHPLALEPEDAIEGELDDTGYADAVLIDERRIPLADIVEIAVRRE